MSKSTSTEVKNGRRLPEEENSITKLEKKDKKKSKSEKRDREDQRENGSTSTRKDQDRKMDDNKSKEKKHKKKKDKVMPSENGQAKYISESTQEKLKEKEPAIKDENERKKSKKKKKEKSKSGSPREEEKKNQDLSNDLKAEKISQNEKNGKKRRLEKGSSEQNIAKKSPKIENSISIITPEQVSEYRRDNEVSLFFPDEQKESHYAPYISFNYAISQFPDCTRQVFDSCCRDFVKPSPIQAQSWPIIQAGKDLVGIASTGSGKTLAFVLPGISKLLSGDLGLKDGGKNCSPRCLVLSPTRELAIQSSKVAEQACEVLTGLFAMVVFGGQAKKEQLSKFKTMGPKLDFLVATPGRLLDFVDAGDLSLSYVRFLVLDEADRMLDMGFEKDVKRIVESTSERRQTVMFSATWPEEIRSIASTYLRNPIRLVIGSEKLAAADTVKQIVEVLEPFAKERRLSNLLKEIHDRKNRIIIFGLYKKEAARLEETLLRQGYKVAGIHGDKSQQNREEAVRRFEKGETPLLVATDVASRGLDIKNVEYVINYTFPLTVEDYVHRIGRTGRAGKKGVAYTFFTSHEKHLAGALQNVLREAGEEIPTELAKFGNTVKKKEHKLYGSHFKQNDGPMKKASHIRF